MDIGTFMNLITEVIVIAAAVTAEVVRVRILVDGRGGSVWRAEKNEKENFII